MGAQDDALERLVYAMEEEPDREFSFVLGSGMSNGRVPGVAGMTELFCAEMGQSEQYDELIDRLGPAGAYQEAARLLTRRRGPRALARVIKRATLLAAPGYEDTEKIAQVPVSAWEVPKGLTAFASVLKNIHPSRRLVVYTTNFDPLIEVALKRRGVDTFSLAVGGDRSINPRQVHGALPVVHLHGFCEDSATLNTILELGAAREELEEAILSSIRDTMTWVMGYGGWEDSFMRAFRTLVQGTSLELLQAEIAWVTHGQQSADIESAGLQGVFGRVGITEYINVDATKMLTEASVRTESAPVPDQLPQGWQVFSPAFESTDMADVVALTEGRSVDENAVASAPLLSHTLRLLDAARDELSRIDGGISSVIAMGPTGEGKSIGLLQAGRKLMLEDQTLRIWRMRPGAPPLTTEAILDAAASAKGRLVLLIDDADLILEELADAVQAARPRIAGKPGVLILASAHRHHDHLTSFRSALGRLRARQIDFEGLARTDAYDLAELYLRSGVLPSAHSDQGKEHVAEEIIQAAGVDMRDASLFGAVLHLWYGEELLARLTDLMERLTRFSVRGVGLDQVLMAIALAQIASDRHGRGSGGLTVQSLAVMLEVAEVDVLPIVISPLGREAGISRVGDRIYCRHPAIAEALIAESDPVEGEAALATARNSALGLLGRGAGRQLAHRERDREVLSALSPYRSLDPEDAQVWGAAYRDAATGRLEARVTYLWILRQNRKHDFATKYADGIETHVSDFSDWRNTYRGFLVEWSLLELGSSRPTEALRLALRSCSDMSGVPLYADQIVYSLGAAQKAARALRLRGAPGALEFEEIVGVLIDRLQGDEKAIVGGQHGPARLVGRMRALSNGLAQPGKHRLHFVEMLRRLGDA
ncbi:P-loop NTPase [Ornithinimicrobium sediminis]